MLSGSERQRRRRVHSEEAIDSLRLKNLRSGYLSRVIALCRATEVLLNDAKNVDEVSKKLLEINDAFARFERAHYNYIATLAVDLEVWESEARYFKEHCHRKMNFESGIERWIQSATAAAQTHENNDLPPEDSMNIASGGNSHLSIRQLRAKQALAHLKLNQLKQKQELLRQEEETKLKLEVLEAQYEVQKTDLQVKLLQDEEPIYSNLSNAFEQPNPFNGQVANPSKQDDSDLRAEQKFGCQDAQSCLNPNAREFKGLSVGSNAASARLKETESSWPEVVMDKIALTIKQGFSLPKKELTIFDSDPLEY